MTQRRVTAAEVARVLTLLSSRPNARKRRRPGDREGYDEWFDGGASRATPAGLEVRFGDGTTAVVAPGDALEVRILFPGGVGVRIAQE